MATRSRGMSAGFGWLSRGISAGFRHPKPLFGGALLVALAAFVPALITVPIQFHAITSTPPNPAAYGLTMIVTTLLSLLVLPIYAGYLQVIDAAESGLPARAGDVFRPYREGKTLRVIGFGIIMLLIYVATLGVFIITTGSGMAHWYAQLVTAQLNHLPPPSTLPDGFGMDVLLVVSFAIFMMGFYSIGLGQIALTDRGIFGAIGDALLGALKNLLPLLMLVLGILVVWIGVAICLGMAVLLIALLGKLIGAWFMVLLVPLYFAMLLVVFTTMFCVMYHLWRDVCGDDIVTGTTEAIAA